MSKSLAVNERAKVTICMEAFSALNHPNFRKLSQAGVGSNHILSSNFGTGCCQTLNTTTSSAILSDGEPYGVVQFVVKAAL